MRRRSKRKIWAMLFTIATSVVAKSQLPEIWPRVGFDLSVLDKNDQAVPGITPDKLAVSTDEKLVSGVTLSASGEEPQSVCLLVESAGSSYVDRKLVDAELNEFLRDLPWQDELCIVDFSSKVYLDAPLSTDRSGVMKAVQETRRAAGSSALLDALNSVSSLLQKNAKFRSRVIVLIADDHDNASTKKAKDVMELFHSAGAPVLYSLLSPGDGEHESDGQNHKKDLERLTEESGGVKFASKSEVDGRMAVQNLFKILGSRYRLSFTTADPVPDGKLHKLDVQLEKELQKQKIKVAVARGYDAPKQ